MEITHDESAKRFNLYDEHKTRMGEIEYMKGGNNVLYATHTEVFPEFEGKGYAGILLDALVGYAKEKGAVIVPICPYVIKAFQKYPEKYKDVIQKK